MTLTRARSRVRSVRWRRIAALIVAAGLLTGLSACGSQVAGQARPAPGAAAAAATGESSAPATPAPGVTGDIPSAPAPSGPPVAEGARQDPQVLEYGFSSYQVPFTKGWLTSYAAIVKNPNPNTWVAGASHFTVTFLDAGGQVVYTDDLVTLYGLGPGQTSAVADTDIFGKAPRQATTMQIKFDRASWFDTTELAPGDVTMSTTATVRPNPDPGSGVPGAFIDCAARSTYRSKVQNINVEIVYRDGTGKIIGGSEQNADENGDSFTPPGNGTIPIRIKALFTPSSGIPAAVCYPSYNKPL